MKRFIFNVPTEPHLVHSLDFTGAANYFTMTRIIKNSLAIITPWVTFDLEPYLGNGKMRLAQRNHFQLAKI